MVNFSIIEMNVQHRLDVYTIYQQSENFYYWDEWNYYSYSGIVAEVSERVIGLASLMPATNCHSFSGVLEVGVYVDKKYQKQGIGTALLGKLIYLAEKEDAWSLIAKIKEGNAAAVNLCKSCNFTSVGTMTNYAKDSADKLCNVILMEKVFAPSSILP